jgi:spore coat protein CotF
MLKHIGRHGDRKVAIVFREIPGEDHMCLVIYPDVLPTHIHNSVMGVLESAPGQQAVTLADVFHRNLLPDGRPILEALHKEGMLKKIATNQVILTPTATSSVKLEEVNRLVREMESGTEAHKRMQEIDQNSGMVDPETKRQQEREFKRRQLEESQRTGKYTPPEPMNASNALDDKALAGNMLTQAKRMETEAQGLIAEAARMKKEAERMFPGVQPGDATSVVVSTAPAKKRGRPSKTEVAARDAAVQ